MHLYRYLDRLQDKAVYCDTDYVIYIQPRNEPALVETGDNLKGRDFGIQTRGIDVVTCRGRSEKLLLQNSELYDMRV
jgi:hypothetical protein